MNIQYNDKLTCPKCHKFSFSYFRFYFFRVKKVKCPICNSYSILTISNSKVMPYYIWAIFALVLTFSANYFFTQYIFNIPTIFLVITTLILSGLIAILYDYLIYTKNKAVITTSDKS